MERKAIRKYNAKIKIIINKFKKNKEIFLNLTSNFFQVLKIKIELKIGKKINK